MGAYKLTPCSISDSDEPISIVEAKIFNLYQNMMAAEKEEEEKITEFTSVFNANKTKGDET